MVQRRKGAAKDAAARYGEFPGELQRSRMLFITRVFIVVFGVIALRLLQLHLSPSHQLSEEDRTHIGTIPLNEPRGEIRDREGLTLATERLVPSLWVDPRDVTDAEGVASMVAKRLGMTREDVLGKLTQRDEDGDLRKFVWMKRWLTDMPADALNEIVEMTDGAVKVQYEPMRLYPQRDLASHLIGFCNRNGDAAEGAELYFDEYLRSTPGKYIARKDGHRQMLGSLTLEHEKPQGGDHVYLTIDAKLQHNLELALDQRMIETNAPKAIGIVMDPRDGAILALACRPAYDPNNYDTADPELRKNRAIVDVFEPGSVFKIVTASAALEHDLVTTETKIDCENGGFNPYGHYVRDYHKLGVEPFWMCFAESSNVAMIKVAAKLGPERLDQWIQRFGFTTATSRQFRGESRGMYRPYAKGWSRLSMGSLPMGQEIAVTALQMARGMAVVANGGFVVEPHYVDRVETPEGEVVYQYEAPAHERILSPSTCDTMKELCAGVVTHGTGEKAQILEYRVGGKTGTAQIARPGGGGYLPGAYTTIFAGFAPVADPHLVSVIIIQEPQIKLHYGGYVCGPVFHNVVRQALIDLEVPEDPVLDKDGVPLIAKGVTSVPAVSLQPDEERFIEEAFAEEGMGTQPDAAAGNLALAAAAKALAAKKEGPKVKREKEKAAKAAADAAEEVTAPIEVAPGQLPDFRGMTKRQVQQTLLPLGIPWDTQGAGWVVEQDPPAGTPLEQVGRCALRFKTREQAKVVDEPQERL